MNYNKQDAEILSYSYGKRVNELIKNGNGFTETRDMMFAFRRTAEVYRKQSEFME